AAGIARGLHDFGVGEDHASRAALRDRENPELEAAAPLPLEQRGVAPGAGHPDDVVERSPRLGSRIHDGTTPDARGALAIQKCPFFDLSVHFEGEPLDLRLWRHGKAIDPLE